MVDAEIKIIATIAIAERNASLAWWTNGESSTFAHHTFKILLTAQLRRQLETKLIRGCQTFPSL